MGIIHLLVRSLESPNALSCLSSNPSKQSSTHMVRNQFGVHQMNDPWSDTTAKPPL